MHKDGSTAGNIKLEFHNQAFEVAVEVLRRASAPDLRFTLEQENEVLATVDVMGQPGLQKSRIFVRQPFEAEFHNVGNIFKCRYELRQNGNLIAQVFQSKWIAMKLRLDVEIFSSLPELPTLLAVYVLKELLY